MLLLYVLHNDIVHNLYTCVLCAIQLIIQGWRFRTLVVGSLVLMPALPLPPLRPALPPLCTTYWSLLLPPCHCMPTRLLLCLTSSAEWWIIIAYLLYLLYFNFYSNPFAINNIHYLSHFARRIHGPCPSLQHPIFPIFTPTTMTLMATMLVVSAWWETLAPLRGHRAPLTALRHLPSRGWRLRWPYLLLFCILFIVFSIVLLGAWRKRGSSVYWLVPIREGRW